ncbi:unnamed protein product [Eruca vesicaria subsp. sativa]|uniref:MORF/ORRM1/DAG-like MORF domain-containing protein n=1 Tax=Eruca vesicaria subsp. sativa TaxID=29727 RepID=A0ABC8M4P2_ERUVS|nr:unnamed protein product [Eruca vesicaria subsp. sativa]
MATTRSISRSIPRLLTRSFASSTPLSKTPSSSSLLSRHVPSLPRCPPFSVVDLSLLNFFPRTLLRLLLTIRVPTGLTGHPRRRSCSMGVILSIGLWLWMHQRNLTRDEIIDGYIKTLAQIVGSEEEARMKIYSVSHRCYFAFGALVSKDLSHKLKELPNVLWVLPDYYLDVKNKEYGGEPFIDGRAVPYDTKYHEEWIRNNDSANYKNRRNRSPPPQRPPMGGSAPPPPHMGQNYGGPPPQNNMGGQRPPPNYGGAPPQNNMGGGPPNAGWSGNNYQQQSGGMQQPQY